MPGAATVCDDGNLCTDDGCAPDKGRTLANNATPWDADGSVCAEADACSAGACKAGKAKDCDDSDPCTVDSCDSAKGCVHTTAPDDTLRSTEGGKWCQAGQCLRSPAFEPVEVEVDGVKQIACAALGPVWGLRPLQPVDVYAPKAIAGRNVVEDAQTNLMWLRWMAWEQPVKAEWAAARTYCDSLVHAGFKDWRTPSLHELTTLVDYSVPFKVPVGDPLPKIDGAAFPGAKKERCWCSALPTDYRVICVRRSRQVPNKQRYIQSAPTGVVADTWTGLEWQATISSGDYLDAKSFCSSLELAGSNW